MTMRMRKVLDALKWLAEGIAFLVLAAPYLMAVLIIAAGVICFPLMVLASIIGIFI